MSFELRPYQREALEAIFQAWDSGVRRPLIVLPTGGGKTVIFASIPTLRPQALPMLVLAHREELLHQAAEKIKLANPTLEVAIERGTDYAGQADVVVASVPTLGRANSSRIDAFGPDYFRIVVVDEAHHAAAATYRRILDYFSGALHLGVTATPQRGDNVRLSHVFDEIVYYRTIRDMIEEGYLSHLAGYRVHTEADLSTVSSSHGDFNERELSEAVNTPARNRLIADTYERLAPGSKTLIFCVDVNHARDVAKTFHDRGLRVRYITGEMDRDERQLYLRAFKEGQLDVLTNCMVLSEGYDEPSVETIIMARPTQSQLLYTQVVGRGLRLYDGKERCLVIDMADTTKNKIPVGLPTLMGLPPDFDSEGEDLLEVANEFQKLADKSASEAAQVRSLGDIAAAYEKIDLFRPPPPNPALLQYSTFIWMEMGPEHYKLGVGNGESVQIISDALGRWHVRRTYPHNQYAEIGMADSIKDAFTLADKYVAEELSDRTQLLKATAPWRNDPPSEKQLKILKKHGIPITSDMTKGEASQILDKIFAENPRKSRPAWVQAKIDRERANKQGRF